MPASARGGLTPIATVTTDDNHTNREPPPLLSEQKTDLDRPLSEMTATTICVKHITIAGRKLLVSKCHRGLLVTDGIL